MRLTCFFLLSIILSIPTLAQKRISKNLGYANFLQGYYYDTDNNCIDGLIRFEFNQDNFFLFKNTYGDKTQKIKAKEMTGFVVLTDSFAIIRDFEIDSIFSRAKPLRFKEGFSQVLETGEVNLYKHQAVINYRIVNTFLLSRNSEGLNKYFTIRKRDTNWFAIEVAAYLKDDEELSKAIKNKEMRFSELRQIVKRYNRNFRADN
jgi:hypothetical protein